MTQPFQHALLADHRAAVALPSPAVACGLADDLLALLFPTRALRPLRHPWQVDAALNRLRGRWQQLLAEMQPRLSAPAAALADGFMDQLPTLRGRLLEDAGALVAGDPAAVNLEEVTRSYPGFLAMAYHRVAHAWVQLQVPLLPRILAEHVHARTGIDIHPAARIGSHCFIDHGTGVVIGATARIGNHVKIYQGVTLGALSVDKDMGSTKRHPTLEDHVVIYANATILGGGTVVGNHSVIGGNVWLTQSVPPYSKVYHKPQIIISRQADDAQALNFSI